MQTTTNMFDLPFDVAEFLTVFHGWTINQDYPGDEWVLLTEPKGGDLRLSSKPLNSWSTFSEKIKDFEGQCDELELTKSFRLGKQENGLRYAAAEMFEDDSFITIIHLEGQYARTVYITTNSAGSIFDEVESAVKLFPWVTVDSTEILTSNDVLKFSELKKLARSTLKDDPGVKEEVLDMLSYWDPKEAYIDLYAFQIEELIWDEPPQYYHLALNLIHYAFHHGDDFELEQWCGIFDLLGPNLLSDESLQILILAKIVKSANCVADYLAMADLDENPVLKSSDRRLWLDKAEKSVADFDDAYGVINHALCTPALALRLLAVAETWISSIEKHDFIYSPISLIQKCFDNDFIDVSYTTLMLSQLLDSALKIDQTLSIIGDLLVNEDEENIFAEMIPKFIHKLEVANASAEEAFQVYEYFLEVAEDAEDSLSYLGGDEDEDEDDAKQVAAEQLALTEKATHFKDRAANYKAGKVDLMDDLIADKEDDDALTTLIDVICQCTAFVSAGDGQLSHAEIEEVDQVRGIVGQFIRNRAAIEELDNTEDIDKARALRQDMTVNIMHVMFGYPAFMNEAIELWKEVQSEEEFMALARLFASKIKDPFMQRVTAWAAKEVASIDGFAEGEKDILREMAGVWGLDLKENDRYFSDVVYPALNDKFEYTGKSGDILETARALDAIDATVDDDVIKTLAEEFGCSSMEDLAKMLMKFSGKEIEEEIQYEDTEQSDFPLIWQALLLEGDWAKVQTLVENGEDPNQTINILGIGHLPILTLACEQGPAEVVKSLVKHGADINQKIANVDFCCGFNVPLSGAIKGRRLDNFDFLIESGADVDPFKHREGGWTPLVAAVSNDQYEMIQTLIERGADVNIATSDWATAFKTACSVPAKDTIKTLKLLLKSGAIPGIHDNEGFAGIHNAAALSLDTVKFLIEVAKVPIDFNRHGFRRIWSPTPLSMALVNGQGKIADYLLTMGANVIHPEDCKTIFRSLSNGLATTSLTDEYTDRFLSLGALPTLEDVFDVFSFLSDGIDQANGDLEKAANWSISYLTVLLPHVDLTEGLDDIDTDELNEHLENLLDKVPEVAEVLINLIKDNGIDIEEMAAN
jgi:ankyrin repeat protein